MKKTQNRIGVLAKKSHKKNENIKFGETKL